MREWITNRFSQINRNENIVSYTVYPQNELGVDIADERFEITLQEYNMGMIPKMLAEKGLNTFLFRLEANMKKPLIDETEV
jgi:hypothetical protein